MTTLWTKLFGAADPEESAFARYRAFHQKEPKTTGEFSPELTIPSAVYLCGPSVHVLYRSNKVDPDTGEDPKQPIDYIHEHDSWGVTTYTPTRPPHRLLPLSPLVPVPDFVAECQWFVKLGTCLGLAYKVRGNGILELEGRGRPLSELYTTPDGKALLVICGKKELEYLIWGGGLDVRPEGIVG